MLLETTKSVDNLWAEAVNTACYIRNRLAAKSCASGRTPYEITHGRRLNLKHVRVFGSPVYVHKPKQNQEGKSHSWAVKSRLVGFNK